MKNLSLEPKKLTSKAIQVPDHENNATEDFSLGLLEAGLAILFLCFLFMADAVMAQSDWEPLSLQAIDADGMYVGDVDAISLSTDVELQITGPIMRGIIHQRFRNPSQNWVEGTYRFPLPELAAVDQMRILVGTQVIEGQIQEKVAAQKRYEKAKSEGKRTSLLQLSQGNEFRTSIANVGPGEEVSVQFEFQQLLDYRDGAFQLRLPIVSTPKYTPPDSNDVTSDAPLIIREANEAPGNPVRVIAEIKAGFPIRLPSSESHQIIVERQTENHVVVGLDASAWDANRDFQLSWQVQPSKLPRMSILSENIAGEKYGLMMLMPPQWDEDNAQIMARELVFVLDVSGSMQGESIRQAKAALIQSLKALSPQDSFNLIWFNNSAWSLYPQSKMATARNLETALHTIRGLDANGGTYMRSAIDRALPDRQEIANNASLRQVIFITDGAVSNEHDLFKLIEDRLGKSRLFTVGIGSAPNSYFMRKAAKAGRGSFTYVSYPGEAQKKMGQLLNKLSAPALADIQLDFDVGQVDVLPAPIPDLYLGEPLYAVFKSGQLPSVVNLSAQLDGSQFVQTFPVTQIKKKSGVAIEWARRKIGQLQSQYRDGDEYQKALIKQEIVDTAIAHHQVSQFTSLVAVDVTPVNASGELEQQDIPANAPKGWSTKGGALQLRLAQTATTGPFNLLLGMLTFLISLMCFSFIGGRPWQRV